MLYLSNAPLIFFFLYVFLPFNILSTVAQGAAPHTLWLKMSLSIMYIYSSLSSTTYFIAHILPKNWKSEFCFYHGQNAFTAT